MGIMLMMLIENYVYTTFDQTLINFLETVIRTLMPYEDPTMQADEYPFVAALIYFLSYVMWPIVLIMVMKKR
jgi:hypothetical protein